MAKYFAVLGILVWATCSVAAACPSAPAQASIAELPPLIIGSATGGQPYYCMATAQASTVGDLSPAEWAKQAQICNTSCDYMPMIPGDPHSLLVPVNCGPGWHDTPFLVEPPRPQKGPATLKIATTGCNAIAPSKGPPAPAASPKP